MLTPYETPEAPHDGVDQGGDRGLLGISRITNGPEECPRVQPLFACRTRKVRHPGSIRMQRPVVLPPSFPGRSQTWRQGWRYGVHNTWRCFTLEGLMTTEYQNHFSLPIHFWILLTSSFYFICSHPHLQFGTGAST